MAWKLAQSDRVEKIYVIPGNGGTATEEKTANVLPDGMGKSPDSDEGQKAILKFALKENIDLVVVGPEAPLAAGIVDKFRAVGLAIVGPVQKAARLETSKVYAKSFMKKYGIRTAACKSFADFTEAAGYSEKQFRKAQKIVIKADGLAAGKGVVIAGDFAEAKAALEAFMKKGDLGEAGKSVLIEEYLEGPEVSVLAAVSVCPGRKGVIKPFIAARDHKRRFEGETGPNTGGMGAVAPVPDFTPALQKDFASAILAPTLKGMEAEKMDYRGFIFFGVLLRGGECYLLEYNARLGDPETQSVLPLLGSDLAELCQAIIDGSLSQYPLKWKEGAVCAPVAASEGYPGQYRKGIPIAANRNALGQTGATLFVAGAEREAGGHFGSGLRTSGGRVLTVSALGSDSGDARKRAYDALRFISFEGMVYRKDIGLNPSAAGDAHG